MQKPDVPEFMSILAWVGELYGKSFSERLTEIYWQALECFELEDVREAFEAHTHNPDVGQYFPKPADIVRFIEGNGETKALRAWAMVERALHQVGRYQSVAFEDLIIHAVLEAMGGWVKLCAMTEKEMPFRAHEFQKRYMGFLLKKPQRYPSHLWGIAECENSNQGYVSEPPLLVGDLKKAKQVMREGGGTPLLVHTQSFEQIVKNLPILQKDKPDELS